MRKFLLIAAVGAAAGYAGVYFAFDRSAAEPTAEQTAAAAPQPAEPAVLAQVVDVTDTDPLLDPPANQAAGTPFDPAESLEAPAVVNATPAAPIPPAAD